MHEIPGAERATDSERGEYNYSQLENSLHVKCVIWIMIVFDIQRSLG